MTKFNPSSDSPLKIIQVSDCHLFAQTDALHVGQPVYKNLLRVFIDIAQKNIGDLIIFTGDLSQDHSKQSYLNFVKTFNLAVTEHHLNIPLYWLPGNHDEFSLFDNLVKHPLIKADKTIVYEPWTLHLLNSKSKTPAGIVSERQLGEVSSNSKKSAFNAVFMHHPPIDVGYFIDKHGLQQKSQFWQTINNNNIAAIFCGHVHRAMYFAITKERQSPIFTCPATSIQFDPDADGLAALNQGPGYRTIYLHSDGSVTSEVRYLENLAKLSV